MGCVGVLCFFPCWVGLRFLLMFWLLMCDSCVWIVVVYGCVCYVVFGWVGCFIVYGVWLRFDCLFAFRMMVYVMLVRLCGGFMVGGLVLLRVVGSLVGYFVMRVGFVGDLRLFVLWSCFVVVFWWCWFTCWTF